MQEILHLLLDNKIIALIGAIIIIMIETFLPMLPLTAIIVGNVFVLGMWLGFFVSWIGSSVASVILYYIANKFSKLDYIKKYKNNKIVNNITTWIHKQGFNSIFISYVCPFIPDFFVTIASGFARVEIKNYVLGMVFGKFVMFLIISYVGDDINKLFFHPEKIILFIVVMIIFWIIGKNINRKIHN